MVRSLPTEVGFADDIGGGGGVESEAVEVFLIIQTVAKYVAEDPEGSLAPVGYRLFLGLLDGLSLVWHVRCNPTANVLVISSASRVHPHDCSGADGPTRAMLLDEIEGQALDG